MHEYSSQEALLLKEYGRNVQKLVQHIKTVESREERTRLAYTVVELMKQIHPNSKELQDSPNKFWDDLYIIAKFSLDVESPFPMPEIESLGKKPQIMEYNQRKLVFRSYGQNIEFLWEKVASLKDIEEQKYAAMQTARLMRSFYFAWYKDNIEQDLVIDQIKQITKGTLSIDIAEVLKGVFDSKNNNLNATFQPNNNNGKNNHHKRKKKKKFGNPNTNNTHNGNQQTKTSI
jgi:Domain of unknown function (DUF4290)